MARVSAEQMFRRHFPNATIEVHKRTGLSMGRYYLVRTEWSALYSGGGDTKPKAWAAACRHHGIATHGAKP